MLCAIFVLHHLFRLEEEAKSLGYYQDAHRVWPVNLDVISWLGAFHVRSEVYERAIPYFELAAAIQPQEVKWVLMVASCYRRIGAYGPALKRWVCILIAIIGRRWPRLVRRGCNRPLLHCGLQTSHLIQCGKAVVSCELHGVCANRGAWLQACLMQVLCCAHAGIVLCRSVACN